MVVKIIKCVIKEKCILGEVGTILTLKRGYAKYFLEQNKLFMYGKNGKNIENLVYNRITKHVENSIEKLQNIDTIQMSGGINSVGFLYSSISINKIINFITEKYRLKNLNVFVFKIVDTTSIRNPGKYSVQILYKGNLIKTFVLDVKEAK